MFCFREDRTWVIMFMAPWCGYCHQFEPEFITVIQVTLTLIIIYFQQKFQCL